jgi:hypothetical protein
MPVKAEIRKVLGKGQANMVTVWLEERLDQSSEIWAPEFLLCASLLLSA